VTAAALVAACRLQGRSGQPAAAAETLQLLRSRPEWRDAAGRAALFLAASQLARGEAETPGLLATAAAGLGTSPEVAYWSGRADEARQRPQAAVPHYLRLLRAAPYHPLARDARARLDAAPMRAAVSAASDAKRASGRGDDRLDAWLLLPAGDARREPLRQQLYQLFARDRDVAPWLRLAPVDPADWPLWRATLTTAEERLLALDGWHEVGLDTILRHFPLRDPALAFTAAQRLAAAGDLPRSLLIGGELTHRLGGRVPLQLLPLPLRQLLLPRPWQPAVDAASSRHGVEPALLWALMREGSGFDPEALPAVGGRGVMLLDPRQAERHAAAAGLATVRPEDLFQPRLAIPLAAARLAELQAAFPGRPRLALARVWGRWCETDDPAELLTKIGSEDVRAAVARVLGTQAAYRELYE
jgi:soluble lytic murein transglycosylase